MTEHEFEKDDLISDLYQAIDKDHPSSGVDREILARAYGAKPAKSGSPFSGGWKVPLSLAAVLVVGLAVVLRLGVSPKQPLPEFDQAIPKMKKEQILETESVPQTALPGKARMATPAPMSEMEDASSSSELREQKQEPMVSGSGGGFKAMERSPARKKEKLEDKILPEKPAGILQMRKESQPFETVVEESGKDSDKVDGLDAGNLPSTQEMEQHLRNYGTMEQFQSPEYWKKEIALLVLDGEIDQANQQLQVFMEAFPDSDVSELEALLEIK